MAKKLKAKRPLQPRIAPDVEPLVRKSAVRASRTCPQEVNHVLRAYYETEEIKRSWCVGTCG